LTSKTDVIVSVSGAGLTATVDPARGGKIVSLVDPSGKEWLAQPSRPSVRPPRENATFVESDPSGWDECAPSIDACSVDGREIPDHGDLWTASWRVTRTAGDELDMSVTGRSLDYRLSRTISPTPTGLRFEYQATTEHHCAPFLWAAHPQFVSPTGSRVELPRVVRTVVDVLSPDNDHLQWSAAIASIDSLKPGGFRKVYADPVTPVSSATLRHPDGAALTLSWEGCPYLGLWFDNGVYASEPVVAIEPSLAFRDSLAWAVKNGTHATIEPGKTLRWSLEVAVELAT
jgi:hypothetical protein